MSNPWITVSCSLGILVVLAVAYHGLGQTRHGRRQHQVKPHAIYVGVAVLTILALPTSIAEYIFTALTVTLVATVFPIYESVRSVCTPEEDDDKAWLQYWLIGGVIFCGTEWVKNVIQKGRVVYWYESMFFFFIWLFFPTTNGAALIYYNFTEPFVAPKVRPLAAKMTNWITALYQTLMNAAHLWLVWIIFIFLPSGLKRIIAVAIGTVYPEVSSITAAATDEVEDDTYWLTYWSCYGCLFLIMEFLETWLGWVPGFYTLIILVTVYLMLPMFQGADKVFRKILVPLAGLQELLMLRDAISVKKSMLKDLDPERARVVRKAIAKFYDDDEGNVDPAELKKEFLSGWQGIKMPSLSNPFAASTSEEPNESTPIV